MCYREKYVYHIKQSYFDKVNDKKLMKNKENGNYRPTYYCIRDCKTGLMWVVPMSKQYEKYEKIYNYKIEKYKKCDNIILGGYDGCKSVFLLQNMFPIRDKYIDHIHTRNNTPVPVKESIQSHIEKNFKKILNMYKKGHKNLVLPDILRLEKIMLNEQEQEKENTVNTNESTSKDIRTQENNQNSLIRPSVKDKIAAKKVERTQQSKGTAQKSTITQNQTKSKNNKEYKAI